VCAAGRLSNLYVYAELDCESFQLFNSSASNAARSVRTLLVDIDCTIVGKYSLYPGFHPGQRAVHNLPWADLGLGDVRGHVGVDVAGVYACDVSSLRSQLHADGVCKPLTIIARVGNTMVQSIRP
jgi:hypothetical protein